MARRQTSAHDGNEPRQTLPKLPAPTFGEQGDFALAHGRLRGQLPDKVRERQIKRRERHQKFWSGLLEDLRADGRLRADADIHLARIMILGSINSIQSWFNPRKGSLEKVADQICDMFFRGVGPADK